MGLARDLTMGPRQGRPPQDPRLPELRKLVAARRPDLVELRRLIDDVGAAGSYCNPRLYQVWMEARNRYAELTGEVTPGPSSPFLEHLRPTTKGTP